MGNILSLAKLKRKNLHMQLTCRAENNNLTTPIISSIVLDMNCEFCQPTLIFLCKAREMRGGGMPAQAN